LDYLEVVFEGVTRLLRENLFLIHHSSLYERRWSVVNLSFSFRTPSTSSYLLVGVNEREDRRLATVETRTLLITISPQRLTLCAWWLQSSVGENPKGKKEIWESREMS
jgi:hypothetical protein